MKRKPVKACFMDSCMRIMPGKVSCNTFYMFFNANSEFSIEAFSKAFERFAEDMPIFTCRLSRGYFKDKWVPVEGYDSSKTIELFNISTASEGDSVYDELFSNFSSLSNKHIDIEKEPPLKIKIFHDTNSGRNLLVMCVHHCLADGRGWLQSLKLLGEYYDAALKGQTVRQHKKNCRSISKFVFSVKPGDFLTTFKNLSKPSKIKEMKPVMELGDYKNLRIDFDDLSIEKIVINKEQLADIKNSYKKYGFTINDILMHIVLKITDKFNMELSDPNRYIGTGILVDLRRYFKQEGLTIANYFALESFEIDRTYIYDLEKFSEELAAFKRRPLGLAFIVPILFTSLFPVRMLENIIAGMMDGFNVQSYMGLATTNFGKYDDYVAGFGSCIEGAAALPTSGVHGFPSVLVSGFKDVLTLCIVKYNDKEKLTKRIKDELVQMFDSLKAQGGKANEN
ncbi:MAG: condensation domain-containing protein [Clostridia bacterium]|nr:condensation domain-containing protein [Clostridia bacterium]